MGNAIESDLAICWDPSRGFAVSVNFCHHESIEVDEAR